MSRGKVKAQEEPEVDTLPPTQATFSPHALSRAMERHTRSGQAAMAGGDVIPRRYSTFVLDFTACEPGVFDEDLSLTLRSLRSSEELGAMRGSGDDPAAVGLGLAKASLCQMNGQTLTDDQREWLWEAIGGGGRQVVCAMYAHSGFTPAEAMGKALKSHTIS